MRENLRAQRGCHDSCDQGTHGWVDLFFFLFIPGNCLWMASEHAGQLLGPRRPQGDVVGMS